MSNVRRPFSITIRQAAPIWVQLEGEDPDFPVWMRTHTNGRVVHMVIRIEGCRQPWMVAQRAGMPRSQAHRAYLVNLLISILRMIQGQGFPLEAQSRIMDFMIGNYHQRAYTVTREALPY